MNPSPTTHSENGAQSKSSEDGSISNSNLLNMEPHLNPNHGKNMTSSSEEMKEIERLLNLCSKCKKTGNSLSEKEMELIFRVGLRYDEGDDLIKRDFMKAGKIFQFLANKQYPPAMFLFFF